MNDQSMHDFFRRQELRMEHAYADDEPVDDIEAGFDVFIKSRSGEAFGFYIRDEFELGNEKNWDAVVWIPRSMIEIGQVHVRRLENNAGFTVTMPPWFAAKKGVI